MSQETRRELVDRLLRFSGELADAEARSLAEDICASALFSIWLAHPFAEFVLPVDLRIVTVASQPLYVLPTHFGRVAAKDGVVRNYTTGSRIYPKSALDLQREHPSIGTLVDTGTGDPSEYALSGKVGVSTQVAAAGEALEALSSSAADGASVLVEIEGLDSNGVWNTTQAALNGVAAVALGTWTYVQTFAKSYINTTTPTTALTSSAGTVTLRKVGGGTRQTLLPYEASREQWQLRLVPTPSSVQTILVPTIRLPRRLFQDADPIPAMWGPAIFERMLIDWRVNRDELDLSTGEALKTQGSEFLRLIGYDNELKGGNKARKQPFGGMR